MKTADLIETLSAGATPTATIRPARIVGTALALGAAAALVVLVAWLGLRDLHQAMRTMSFWMKAGYTSLLALAGVAALLGLSRPGGKAGPGPPLAALAVAVLAALALGEAVRTPASEAAAIWLGHSWRACPLRILVLSVPIYAALVWALRRLAPTRMAAAGAAAGCLAGAVGATVYGLYCQETTPAFVLLWYSLGIGASAAAGVLAGRWLLRW